MRAAALALASALLALAAPALAQPAPGPGPAPAPAPGADRKQDLEEAKALVQKAEVEFKLAHFDAALAGYTAAYQKYPTPALLLNLGQCNRMLKNYEQAIFFYKGYLRDKPDAPNRAAIEALIEDSKKALDQQKASAAADEQARRHAEEAQAAQTQEQLRIAEEQARAAAAARAATVTPKTTGSPALRAAGLATAGVGVVAIGVGVVLGLRSSSISNELVQDSAAHKPWTPAEQSLYSQGSTFATTSTVLYVAGGVVAGAGALIAILGWPRKGAEASAPPATTASIAPLPGGGALMLRGSFE